METVESVMSETEGLTRMRNVHRERLRDFLIDHAETYWEPELKKFRVGAWHTKLKKEEIVAWVKARSYDEEDDIPHKFITWNTIDYATRKWGGGQFVFEVKRSDTGTEQPARGNNPQQALIHRRIDELEERITELEEQLTCLNSDSAV
jgi:hypothetical protein